MYAEPYGQNDADDRRHDLGKHGTPPDHDLPAKQGRQDKHQCQHDDRLNEGQNIGQNTLLGGIKCSCGHSRDRVKRNRHKENRHDCDNTCVYLGRRAEQQPDFPSEQINQNCADYRQCHSKFIRQCFGLLERFSFASPVELAHKRLAAVTDTLQEKIDNADDIGNTGVGGDRLLSAVGN